jgi:O-antigen ligase
MRPEPANLAAVTSDPAHTRQAVAEHPANAAARTTELVRHNWPLWLLAFSLNGFFLYLALLDAVDVDPSTPLTGTYYAALGAGLAAAVWRRRKILVSRLRSRRLPLVVCLTAAAALAGWFLLNTLLLSDGPLARRLAGLLVLWTIPTALLALTLRARELPVVARALVALGLILIPIEALAVARAGDEVFRFTPIAELDVITAGLVPAIAAVAALSLRPSTTRTLVGLLAIVALLTAAAVVPGSRGPVLALLVAALALAFVRPLRLHAPALAAVAIGLALGSVVGSNVGSFGYLTSIPEDSPAGEPSGGATRQAPISTLSIRRQWIEDALGDAPERPLFGHGVGMFEDRTPEARLMGVYGQRTYPHNTFVEALYSLGIVGLIAYSAFLGAAAAALIVVWRRWGRREAALAFAVGIAAFAFVNTNVSGEVGSDALLWSAAAVALALYAESQATRGEESDGEAVILRRR